MHSTPECQANQYRSRRRHKQHTHMFTLQSGYWGGRSGGCWEVDGNARAWVDGNRLAISR